MKKSHMTFQQKTKLMELTKDQEVKDTIINFGADLYREGYLKGGLMGVVAFGTGLLIGKCVEKVVCHFEHKKSEEEES